MADTYLNPYTVDTPLGSALKNLSTVLTKGPNEAQNVLRAEAALKLKRENENTAALGSMFRQYGSPEFNPAAATDLAIRANVSPENLGGYDRYNAATTYGAADPRTDNAAVGAGGAFSTTAAGSRESLDAANQRNQATIAEQRYQFDNKPITVGTPQGPVISRQSEAYGQPAVEDLGKVKGNVARVAFNAPGGLAAADATTKNFIGADGGAQTPRNYVAGGKNFVTYDGLTDATTGQPLPPGGALATLQGDSNAVGLRPSVQGSLQESNIANERLKRIGAYAQSLISPQNVGATGIVKGFAQDATQLATNLATGLGYNGLNDAIVGLQKQAQAQGINPNTLPGLFTFDPSVPKIETAYDMFVMAAADAFAGGMNKASDRDIKIMKNIVGDPKSLFSSPESLNAKMGAVNDIIGINHDVNAQHLRGGAATPAAPAAPGAAPSPGAAPGAPPTDVPTATGPNGQKLFLRNGQWQTQ